MRAAPGAITATRGGTEVWRRTGPLRRPTDLQVQVAGRRVLLLSREDAATGMDVVLSAYALTSGKPLWTRRLYENHGAFPVHLAGRWQETVLVTTGAGDIHWPDVAAFDLGNGGALWKRAGELLGRTANALLAADSGVGDPNQTIPASVLPLWRAGGPGKGKVPITDLVLKLPSRSGCGAVAYQSGFPDLRFTNRFLYALRQDSCGKFIVRFPWQADIHTPWVYPDRRPSGPAAKP